MEWSINKTDCNSKRNPDDRETNKTGWLKTTTLQKLSLK